ncbi:hypothetical protein L207DRAFT_563071 [Hyaloscypha variabilis F]|uniref:Uncharacterized protein n=1 Tax=Hyaloscypha variabilis (strain UAMH 11265 / GT02V1 / F) TaxID=1149755 RepID=A0A2J6RZR1_HYAVF|nr:hypothetical protein L207DRAFT_563071 [Hyaloscypha variabilis F]
MSRHSLDEVASEITQIDIGYQTARNSPGPPTSKTPQTSTSSTPTTIPNHARTLRITHRLWHRYKRVRKNAKKLARGKLQVHSRAFRFVRRNRRGRDAELKALICRLLGRTKEQEIGARGWIMVFLDAVRKIGANFGRDWLRVNRNRNRLWPRRAGTDVVRFEESPSPSLDEQREMDVKVYNDKLGTWDSLTEWEEVQK